MLDKLREIFNCYKEVYNLKTVLYFKEENQCYFETESNYICYDVDFLKNNNIVGFNNTQPIKERLIFALLHEIKHAIDWKYNRELCKKAQKEMDWTLYFWNENYHSNLLIEKRANEFAQKELKKWTNI